MKNQALTALLAAGLLMTACQSAPEADSANTGEATAAATGTGSTFTVDTVGSSIGWIGTKQNGQHNGTFMLSGGSLTIDSSNNIASGSFTINIGSLNVLDLQGEDKGKLEGHLKSPDFFDAATFPTAKFEIASVAVYDSATATSKLAGATHIITGNLTLKDSTKSIAFPAIVSIDSASVSTTADFNIDRTLWGMNYKGPNNPADWFIKKEVNLKLNIKAKKAQ